MSDSDSLKSSDESIAYSTSRREVQQYIKELKPTKDEHLDRCVFRTGDVWRNLAVEANSDVKSVLSESRSHISVG